MTTHPPRNHIPGRDYTTAIRGRLLTDADILRYMLAGRYGEAARLRAVAAQRTLKRASRPRATPALKLALDLLNNL